MSSKRKQIRTVSFITALMAILSAFAIKASLRADYYRRVALGSARQAAADLSTSAENTALLLEKCTLSPDDELTAKFASQLYGSSLLTAAAIDALPWQHELEDLTSTIEDIEYYAIKCAQTRQADKAEAERLYKEFTEASQKLSDDYNVYHGGYLSFGSSVIDPFNHTEDQDISDKLNEFNANESNEVSDVKSFSSPAFSEDEAKDELMKVLPMNRELKCSFSHNGTLDIYTFTNTDCSACIDASSGKLLYYSRVDSLGGDAVSTDEALNTAKEFMKHIGGSADIRTYRIDDGYLRCDAIMSENDISALDTPVIIIVDLGDGQVSGFSAINYASSFAGNSGDNVKKESGLIAPENAMNDGGLCTINSPWNENITCSEYIFQENGKKYIVYYNCETGLPVDLRIITEDESGITVR